MFNGGLILNHISKIRRILNLDTYNTNLLLNSDEVSNILVPKEQFWYENKNYSDIYLKKLKVIHI